MKCLRRICKVSLKDKIRNEIILGWCNAARVSNIVSHRRLRWLGHLARMPDERLPKRVLFGHMDGSGLRGKSQKQWVDYVREDLHYAGLLITWWRKSQDRAGWRAATKMYVCCNAPDLRIGKRVMMMMMMMMMHWQAQ